MAARDSGIKPPLTSHASQVLDYKTGGRSLKEEVELLNFGVAVYFIGFLFFRLALPPPKGSTPRIWVTPAHLGCPLSINLGYARQGKTEHPQPTQPKR